MFFISIPTNKSPVDRERIFYEEYIFLVYRICYIWIIRVFSVFYWIWFIFFAHKILNIMYKYILSEIFWNYKIYNRITNDMIKILLWIRTAIFFCFALGAVEDIESFLRKKKKILGILGEEWKILHRFLKFSVNFKNFLSFLKYFRCT